MVTDTLKALTKVTVAGEINDHSGKKLIGFNGQVTAVVYDKAATRKTLGNAGATPFSYKLQNSVIYKGEATVTGVILNSASSFPKTSLIIWVTERSFTMHRMAKQTLMGPLRILSSGVRRRSGD